MTTFELIISAARTICNQTEVYRELRWTGAKINAWKRRATPLRGCYGFCGLVEPLRRYKGTFRNNPAFLRNNADY